MDTEELSVPEVFSALCAEDFADEDHAAMEPALDRTTCMSPSDNLIWDD